MLLVICEGRDDKGAGREAEDLDRDGGEDEDVDDGSTDILDMSP